MCAKTKLTPTPAVNLRVDIHFHAKGHMMMLMKFLD